MRNIVKIFSILVTTIMLAAVAPPAAVQAQSTTVEVYNGSSMILEPGRSIAGSRSGGIPITVKNLPDLGQGNGFAGFTITLTWDSRIVQVDSVSMSQEAEDAGWNSLGGEINNSAGFLTVTGFNVSYYTTDIILVYLGITAVGEPGQSTVFSVNIQTLIDKDNTPIPAVPANLTVFIAGDRYITITPPENSLAAGETREYRAEIIYSNGRKEDITGAAFWTSSNEAVAKIQSSGQETPGLATAVKEGIATLTAEYNNVQGSIILMVTPAKEKPLPPEDTEPQTPAPDTPAEKDAPETPETGTPAVTDDTPQPEKESSSETKSDITRAETDVEKPGQTEEKADGTSTGLPMPWIIGGVVVVAAVLVVLGYTFLARRRF